MKKINIFLLLFICTTFSLKVFSQCANDNTLWIDLTPPSCPGTVSTSCIFGGEYCTVTVVSGNTYTFQTCGNTAFDTEISLYNQSTGLSIGYNDDGCGTQSTITWVATFSGVVRVLVDQYPCSDVSTCMSLSVSCSPPLASYNHPTTGLQGTYLGACMVNTCNANYYDNGGAAGNYSSSINSIYRTFCPSQPGNCLRANFTSFNVESGWDYFYVMNGPTQNSPQTFGGPWTGATGPGTVTSTDNSGCLGFRFYSDGTVTSTGWAATLSCVPCANGPTAAEDNNCTAASSVCGNSPLTGAASGPGLTSECSGCVISENYSSWYKIYIGTSGTLALTIVPAISTDDYDFSIWGPSVGCGSISSTSPIRCSYAMNTGNTGLNSSGVPTEYSEDVSGDGWVRTLNVTAGQTYYLMVNGWTASAGGFTLNWTGSTATLGVPPGSVTVQSNNTCPGLNQGSACAVVNAGLPPYTYSWNTGSTATCITNQAPGNYTVTVNDGSGCQSIASGTISNFGSPTATLVPTNVLCFGNSTGSVNNTPSGGTPGYTYNWNTGATTEDITGRPAGTYTVTVTDANGCNTVSSTTITQPASALSVTTSNVNVACFGGSTGSATVSASGGTPGYTYAWAPSGGSGATASSLPAGSYTCTITDVNGCSTTRNFTITQPASALSATVSQTNVSCNGGTNGSATATPSGGTAGYTYTWSSGPTTATISNLSVGTYTVTVRDANNCSTVQSVTITQPTLLTSSISASTQVLCNGGNNGSATVTQSGGTAPYTYLWSNSQTGVTASSLIAGNYTVTVTDNKGCTAVSSVAITQPSAITATVSQVNVSCNGGSNGTATANPSGGTPGYTYTWTNGQTTQTATNLASGTYTVTIKDANNCTITRNVTITQPTTLTSSISSQTNVACNGGNNGTATVLAGGGTPAYTYLWSNAQTSATAINLVAGTYNVTVTDNKGCTSTSSVTISQPSVLTRTTSSTSVLCNGGNTGTATVTPSGGTPGYTYLWSNAQTTATATGLIAGTYTVTVRDVNNCSTTASVTVTQPTAVTASISGQTNVLCNGGSNGTATVSAGGGTPSYTYLWSNAQTGATATGLAAGTYTVTVRDANNCSATQSVTITQPAVLNATASSTNTSCNGGSNGSTTASPSGGTSPYTYNWFPGGQTTQTATGLTAGTYSVTVSDNNGCSVIRTATVNQPAAISLTPSKTDATCGNSNGSASISASGGTPGYTYLWSNGGTTASITNIAAGSYTVTVRDVNNCSNTATISVNNSGAPTVSVTSSVDVSCFGGSNGSASISATGGTPGYTYLWSNGATGTSISNVISNTYSVTVTDNIGCQASTSVNIAQPTQLISSITGNVSPLCFGSSNGSATVSASGGSPAYTYLWSSGSTSNTASGLAAGNYTVTITDTHSCTSTSSVTVTQPSVVSSTISTFTNVSCNGGSNGSATVVAGGGTPSYTYLWSQGTTTATATNLIAGTYTVTVTDNNSCTSTTSVTITQPTTLTSTVSGVNVSCNGGSNGTATVTPAGGTPAYTYLWSNTQTTVTASGLSAGSYTVTVTDNKGCTSVSSVTITQPTTLSTSITVNSNVLCNGGSTGSATVNPTGGTPSFTYLWSNSQTVANATGLIAGAYTVTVTDNNGCTSTSSVTITQPTVLANTTSTTSVLCNGGSTGTATITPSGGTPGYTYLWSNAQTTATATGLSAGTYTVTVRDVNNCSTTASITVTQPTVLTSSISTSTQVSCNGGSNGSATVLPTGGTPAYTYIWSNGQSTATASNLVAATYTVTVTDNKGCTSTSSVIITQPTQLVSSISTYTNVSCNGGNNGTATVSPSGGTPGYTYLWSNTQTVATATNLSSGSYTVTVTDNQGCTSVSSITITQPTTLTSSISASTPVLCFGGSSGTATVNPTGGTPSYTYLWSNTQTAATAINLTIGTYTVTVTDNLGCTSVSSVTITQPTALSSSISTQTNVFCNGGSNGSATVAASGGSPGYTYSWSNSQTGVTATGLTSGAYTVTVTDINNCTSTSSVTITQPATLTVTSTTISPTCNGGSDGSITANPVGGTGPYTYNWFPSGQINQTATGLNANTYTVTVTDVNSCTYLLNTTLSQPSAISITPSYVDATCGNSNGSASVAVSGGTPGYTYLWSNSSTGNSISGIPAGSYSITVTDSQSCTNTSVVSVNNSGAPTISLVSSYNVSCNGGNNGSAEISVTGGTPGYIYLWSNGATGTTISNVTANNYNVTVTDNIGCQATYNINITQPTVLIASIVGTTSPTCYGLSDGTATVNASGGTPAAFPPYNYNWSNSQTTATATGLSSGIYNVTITDDNGCTTTTSANITQPTQVVSNINTYSDVLCNGGSTGSATVTASGGIPGYTYLWSNSNSTDISTNLTAGNYTVTVYDSNNCTSVSSITINEPTLLVVTIPLVQNVACHGQATGQLSASATGGSPMYNYAWSNGTLTASNSGLVAGTYTVTVTDTHNCTATNTTDVIEPDSLVALASVNIPVSCNGGNNGSASASPTGGTPAYFYSWSNGSNTSVINNLTIGDYIVTITDSYFCTSVDTVTITEPTVLAFAFVSDSTLCYGSSDGQVDFTPSGGVNPYTYQWSNGAITEDLSNVASGSYTVTITDGNGCTSSQSVQVNEPAMLNATFTSVDAHCNQNDGSVTVNPSGGTPAYTFEWDSNAGGQLTQTASNLFAGNYDVTITDSHSCTEVFNGSILNLNPATVVFDQVVNNVCFGDTAGFVHASITSGGTPPFNFLWSTGSTADTLFNLLAGDYILTTTDATGCITVDTVNVASPTMLQVTIDSITPITCYGYANGNLIISISGGTPSYTYLWQNQTGDTISQTNEILNVSAGNYYFTVTDANNCIQTFNSTLNQPAELITSMLEPVSPKCSYSSDGQAVVIAGGGTPPLTFLWDDALITANDTVSTLSGPADYHVTVTDANGCFVVDTVHIDAPAPVQTTVYSFPAICSSANGWGYVEATGGSSNYFYNWSDGVTITDTILNLSSGIYYVTVSDANACTAVDSITIINASAGNIQIDALTDVNCYGDTTGLVAISLQGGTAPFVYSWDNGSTSDSLINVAAGTYAVTITDANNCVSDTTVTINQPISALASNFNYTGVSCYGLNDGSSTVMPSGGTAPYSILWSNGDTLTTISGLSPAAISVQITDANGCVVNENANISEPTALSATVQNYANPNCGNVNDGFISVDVTGGTLPYTYLWSTSDTTLNITGLGSQSYSLTITDFNSCTEEISQTLVSSSNMTDSIVSGNGTDNLGWANVIVTGGTPGFTYIWSNGATSQSVYGLTPGTYYVTISDANTCFITDSVVIDIPLIIPSVITPNGDGRNDDFRIVGIEGYPDVSIEIYNRWGDILFVFAGTGMEYSMSANRWNGQYQNKDLPMGSYVYIIKLGTETDPISGVCSIIR